MERRRLRTADIRILLSRDELKKGLVSLAVGAAGGWIAQWIGVPAGVAVGALVASGLYRLSGGSPGRWRDHYGRSGRLLLGTTVGAVFGPSVLEPLKVAFLPMCVVIVTIIAVGLGLGWALGRVTTLDPVTALVSGIPGGLPAMVAIADETGADATVVAAVHFSRLTTILVVVPLLIPVLTNASGSSAAVAPFAEPVGFGRTVVSLIIGLVGGLLAVRARIPSGDMMGAIVAVGAVNLFGPGPGPLPMAFRTAAMLLVGTAVGTQMSRESLRLLRRVALPAGVLIVTLISVGVALGWGLSRVTSLDLTSALLSSVPGGASTMPLVAHELGGDVRVVAALHLTRQLVVFSLLPAVLNHLLRTRRSASKPGRFASAGQVSTCRRE